ncbi:protein of unknown function [Cupriavidus taiwanensis]|uniref:Uncharacterized protein n=1 Tax=Cupriavidus taiwanensis TaxID=164546 RepID=A0A375IEX3_9BURK|nr:hypothetical protein CBM2608_A70207 [Cupriavidus taiwanensis]SPK72638.1 protein of unknown function [Cupriavidus taiwanensis]
MWNIVPYRGTIARRRPYRIPARPGHASPGQTDSAGARSLADPRTRLQPGWRISERRMEALLESSP